MSALNCKTGTKHAMVRGSTMDDRPISPTTRKTRLFPTRDRHEPPMAEEAHHANPSIFSKGMVKLAVNTSAAKPSKCDRTSSMTPPRTVYEVGLRSIGMVAMG